MSDLLGSWIAEEEPGEGAGEGGEVGEDLECEFEGLELLGLFGGIVRLFIAVKC